MNRRTFIATSGIALVAGCTASAGSEVSETVRGDTDIFNLDVSEGETIEIELENERGFSTYLILTDTDDEELIAEGVETEETFEHTAETTGTYRIYVSPDDEASVTVWIED